MQRRRFTIEFEQQVIQEAKEVGNASQVARRQNIKP
ncbi:transposase-like protein [Paenibacillus polymyxa]|nr:transposase-like protein [Paenibacillus polymyxa]